MQFLFTRATDFCCKVLCDIHVEVIWMTVLYLSLFLPFESSGFMYCRKYLFELQKKDGIYFNILDS